MSDFEGAAQRRGALYRTIWRWHFYAGLSVMPFILILAVTGAIYLFKPQTDRWQDSQYRTALTGQAVSANEQLAAAMTEFPDAQFSSYRLPETAGDAAMIHVALADGHSMRDVFVSPQGRVMGSRDPEAMISATVARIHGSLLLGRTGSWLVELAASWAIVMILTGLYLWWPRGRALAGVLWPRLSLGKRIFWRDIHAVTGFWVSGLALILLLTALPWAGVWGDAFETVRTEMGWTNERPDWKIGGEHGEHDHQAMLALQASGAPMTALSKIVAKARAEKRLPYPVLVKPPGEGGMVWTIQSASQNRPLNQAISYDMATGEELSRKGFAEKHPIDQAVVYGIAWHEGQLFGWVNQLIGLFTALALITLMVSGFVMWRRRKPDDALGAPPLPAVPARISGVVAIILVLAALLPLLALSLILLWLFDRVVLPRLPNLSRWLGLQPS